MNATTVAAEGSPFSRFTASCEGRLLRVGLGASLITAGLGAVGGIPGAGLALVGLAPLVSGAFNLCPIAPAWGGHFFGSSYCSVRSAPNDPTEH